VATADSGATAEDAPLTLNLVANDSDVDGNLLSVQIVTAPAHGAVVVNADRTVTYTPAADYFGADAFEYRASDGAASSPTVGVTLTVTPVNDAPVAVADAVTVLEDGTVSFDLRANDGDIDSAGPLGTVVDRGPLNGTLTVNADGSYSYRPAADFSGTDSVRYRATDAEGASSAAVDVTITVTPVNDAPAAAGDVLSLAEDGALVLRTQDFGLSDRQDTPANALAAVVVTRLPERGRLLLDGVALTAPQDVTAAAIAAGHLRFVPAADENGNGYASLWFRVRDDGGTTNGGVDTSTTESRLVFDVQPVNDAPVITPLDDVVVDEGETVGLTLQVTDIDSPPPHAFTVEAGPAGAAVDAGGRLTWRSGDGDADYAFRVRATDSDGASDVTSFIVRVRNVGPSILVAGADSTQVGERYELALTHADPGDDPVLTWVIDWGDGSQETLAPGAATAVHVYQRPIDAAQIRVTVTDEDGNWRVLAPWALKVEGGLGYGGAAPAAPLTPATLPAPLAPVTIEAGTAPAVGFDLSVSAVGQSAHPWARAIAEAMVDSLPPAGAGLNLPPGPVTAEQVASAIDAKPLPPGQLPALHVRSAVATAGGIRVRFSQPLDVARLVQGTPPGELPRSAAVVLLRNGEPVRGHLAVDPDGAGFLFVPEGGLLAEGTYSLTLRSGTGALVSAAGQSLDGDHDGVPGGDFRARLQVTSTVRVGTFADADDARVALDTGLPWVEEIDAPLEATWSLLGGLGGAATLMTALVPIGIPVRRERALGRRAAARREADDRSAPRVRMEPADVGTLPTAAPAPAWVSRWVDAGATKKANSWSIRI
jgi:hypothetical protein